MIRSTATLSLLLALCACGHTEVTEKPTISPEPTAPQAAPAHPRVFDGLFADGRRTLSVDALIALAPLGDDENIKVASVGADENSSHHVVALRDAEPLHRHDLHDLFAVVLRGHGRMLIGKEERQVGPGSMIYVPRATVHSLRNDAEQPIVGYIVFTPPFDGKDRVLVEQAEQ